jgi:predicted Rossmann fold nucleotide-binding protein DprA/Smf involved in DNA uptake
VPHAVTITGSRSTRHREAAEYGRLFRTYLQPFAHEDAQVYIGGAPGIDTLALDWLVEHSCVALTVVVPCTLADQPDEASDAVLEARRAQRSRW